MIVRKDITKNELLEKIKTHFVFTRSGLEKDKAIFDNYIFGRDTQGMLSGENLSYVSFRDCKFIHDYSQFDGKMPYYIKNTNLLGSNFSGADVRECSFNGSHMEGADFRNAQYSPNQFSDEQKIWMIFTDADEKRYKEKLAMDKKTRELEKTNKIIAIRQKEISQKKFQLDQNLKNRGVKNIKRTVDYFRELGKSNREEEVVRLILSIIFGIVIGGFSLVSLVSFLTGCSMFFLIFLIICILIILLFMFMAGYLLFILINNKKPLGFFIGYGVLVGLGILVYFMKVQSFILSKYDFVTSKTTFNLKTDFYYILPISGLLIFTLYFSIRQYIKAKTMRIENENKVALIQGYMGFQDTKDPNIKNFGLKMADVVFCKAIPDKNPKDMPIDDIIELVKATPQIKLQ